MMGSSLMCPVLKAISVIMMAPRLPVSLDIGVQKAQEIRLPVALEPINPKANRMNV